MSRQTDYDLVIAGAGVAGLTLACHLIDQDLRIAIIDRNDIDPIPVAQINDPCESPMRVTSITLGSQQSLEQLHVWQRLAKTAFSPFERIAVWEPASTSRLFFDAADTGHPYLGTIVKNTELRNALIIQCKNARGIDYLSTESIEAIHQQTAPTVLFLASGRSISTRLLVGADGAQSCVRQLVSIQENTRDYQQQAIVATVQTALPHEQTARQIFLSTGPLALLPLADPQVSSIVWSTTPDEAEMLQALSGELFCQELARASEHCLGDVKPLSTRLSFPLKTQQCDQYIRPGIALIGDAAHTLHPLAGQGANLGIADALCLARVLLEAQQKQRDIGAFHTLRRYERERRFHNRLMSGGTDLIKHLFETRNPLLQSIRSLGISTINKTAWIKNRLAHYAMGKPPLHSFHSTFE